VYNTGSVTIGPSGLHIGSPWQGSQGVQQADRTQPTVQARTTGFAFIARSLEISSMSALHAQMSRLLAIKAKPVVLAWTVG